MRTECLLQARKKQPVPYKLTYFLKININSKAICKAAGVTVSHSSEMRLIDVLNSESCIMKY